MKRALLVLALVASACTKDNPTNPSPTPTPTPTPTTVSLSGTVSAQAGGRIAGATVTFVDGANAGRSTTTNGSGEYRFDGVTRGNANLGAVAPDFEENRRGIFVDNNTLSFTLRTLFPWSRAGSGPTVFDMPTYITRARITGTYGGRCENFIIWIGGRLIVNEILGTCSVASTVNYDGTHVVTGGVVEVKNSIAINWVITEMR